MTDAVDCAVIGAGVIGLAVARALALRGREVVVLEVAETIGTGISSRNSEVIHAGIYYPKDSLKARFCVQGRKLLYRYCADHGIEHRRCGKLIVAENESQMPALDDLRARGEANGVEGLQRLDRRAVERMEPALKAAAVLHSPVTGIVDSHAYMLSLQGDAEAAGTMIAFHSPVEGGRIDNGQIILGVGGGEPMNLACRTVVNAAGLGAQNVAKALAGLPAATIPRQHLAKGNYFHLTGKPPFTRLIYPVPDTHSASLGVHYTLDLGGQAKFGPDVEWIDAIDFDVDPGRGDAFYAAVRRYWPDLADGALQPGYAGVRPKLQARGEAPADFVIQGPDVHGIPGLINLYGIESPGLTSSLAIADAVAGMLE
jgi:L-2-hydroxyglutarate oxidase LhgO